MIDRLREENGPAALIQDPSKRARHRTQARAKGWIPVGRNADDLDSADPDRDAPTRTTAAPSEMAAALPPGR
jgi:hypothetical protein